MIAFSWLMLYNCGECSYFHESYWQIIHSLKQIQQESEGSRRQTENVWEEKKGEREGELLQGKKKIFQIYCWPTDTIPYLMGL